MVFPCRRKELFFFLFRERTAFHLLRLPQPELLLQGIAVPVLWKDTPFDEELIHGAEPPVVIHHVGVAEVSLLLNGGKDFLPYLTLDFMDPHLPQIFPIASSAEQVFRIGGDGNPWPDILFHELGKRPFQCRDLFHGIFPS